MITKLKQKTHSERRGCYLKKKKDKADLEKNQVEIVKITTLNKPKFKIKWTERNKEKWWIKIKIYQ